MTDSVLKAAMEIANKWGIFAAIVVFFIWRSDARETAMRAEMERDRSFVRDTMLDAVNQNTAALARCSAVLAEATGEPAATEPKEAEK